VSTDPAGRVDIADRLWSSDIASALTNEAAREIERLRTVLTETHAKIDAVLRGNHAGWAQALSDIRAALAPAEGEKE
jgi:hypothetical protein